MDPSQRISEDGAPPETPARGGLLSTGQWNRYGTALGRQAEPTRWIGWRLRLLVASTLLGCLGIFWVAHGLSVQPHLGATWRTMGNAKVELNIAPEPSLKGTQGKTLASVSGEGGGLPAEEVAVDALTL